MTFETLKTTKISGLAERITAYYDFERGVVRHPSGMLMGMPNKGSTLVGLVGTTTDSDCIKLQSSDNFVCFIDTNIHNRAIATTIAALKFATISIIKRYYCTHDSIDKTYAVEGEDYISYNSLWRFGKFRC